MSTDAGRRNSNPAGFESSGTDMTWEAAKDVHFRGLPNNPGVLRRVLVDDRHHARHIEAELLQITEGGELVQPRRPAEESFYILSGKAKLIIDGTTHSLTAGDVALVPFATAYQVTAAWGQPMSMLAVRSPRLPRRFGGPGPASAQGPAVHAENGRDGQPTRRGDQLVLGRRASTIGEVDLTMLVDAQSGAAHHSLFIVTMPPTNATTLAAEHYHQFEEFYFILDGTATASVNLGHEVELQPGDAMWVGVGTTHRFSNYTDKPLRWLEAQAPQPPSQNALVPIDEWAVE